VLERLKADEAAAVLRILLERHQSIREEAEQIATQLVSSPSEGTQTLPGFVTLVDSASCFCYRKKLIYTDPR
jgi:hypothetical protein